MRWCDCSECGPHKVACQGDPTRVCFCPCHETNTNDNEEEPDGS